METSQEARDIPFSVSDVKFKKGTHTRHDYLVAHLKSVLEAKTLGSAYDGSIEGLRNLKASGLFSYVDLYFDRDENNRTDTANLWIDVDEKSPWKGQLKATQSPATGEKGVNASIWHCNLLGRGEVLQASAKLGSLESNDLNLTLTKPVLRLQSKLNVGVFSQTSHVGRSSYKESKTGTELSLTSNDGQHRLSYMASWRDVSPYTRHDDANSGSSYAGPSATVLGLSGTSVLSSLKYQWTLDQRNYSLNPTNGRFLMASAEVAGLGGDVAFARANVMAQIIRPYSPTVSFGLSARAGLLDTLCRPFTALASKGERPRSHLPDRYFGGPLLLRGIGAIGPQDTGDQLGGELFSAVCARVNYMPKGNPAGFGFHAFLNAANVMSLEGKGCPSGRDWLHGHRLSTGLGVVLPVSGARVEINVSQPLVHASTDSLHRLQLGLGIQFL